ncbi:MAG: NAD-binding protein [Anaerolineaceae bacterium]
MKNEITLREKFQYWLDNQFSRGTGALITWLGILSLVVVVLAAIIVTLFGISPAGEGPLGFWEAFWVSLMRTLDAGTMGGDAGWGFRLVMFAVTLGGVFVISTLIGVLTSGVESKLENLQKGKSRVLESNQTVILGWSEQIFTVISELVIANANQRKPCIVVMADHDKVEMEETIRTKVEDSQGTRIVCRSGSPMDVNDLEMVNLNSSKSIIILPPDGEDPDSEVIKTVLAIVNHPKRIPGKKFHIVAELYDPRNIEVARVVGKDEVEWIQIGDFVAKVIAQSCRQSGLSVVYTELLDFGGDEIYFHCESSLEGKTFQESLLMFDISSVIGLKTVGGSVALNPPMQTVVGKDDQLIFIAEDDDKITCTGRDPVKIQLERIAKPGKVEDFIERTLILGWNKRGAAIINELDNYVSKGSEILVIASHDELNDISHNKYRNEKVKVQSGDITNRRTLDELDLVKYDHVILLSYTDRLAQQQADAKTLITLLHLRDIADKRNQTFSIVSEMQDIRNRNLADVTRANDFIVSDKLISLMAAQVSENKNLNPVLEDLFDPEGSEIYLKPVGHFIKTGEPVNFYTIVHEASSRGAVAIGYRINADSQDASRGYGVVINPDKNKLVNFVEADKIIVISEE